MSASHCCQLPLSNYPARFLAYFQYQQIMSEIGPQEVNRKKNRFQPRKKRKKLEIVFDENARREFLTGFHKRKVQRKNKAKEELEMQLKAERKRIKAEAKEQYMKLLLAQKPIPEFNDLMSENIDMGTHSVSVTELSTADLARKNNWIGINEVQYQERENEENERVSEIMNTEEVEGMDIKKKDKNKLTYKTSSVKSCKDIKKKIKQQATANVKNSKIFQKKAEFERNKNLKLIRKQQRKLEKVRKKYKRSKHKIVRDNYNRNKYF